MESKYLKYKKKYMKLKMIGGTILSKPLLIYITDIKKSESNMFANLKYINKFKKYLNINDERIIIIDYNKSFDLSSKINELTPIIIVYDYNIIKEKIISRSSSSGDMDIWSINFEQYKNNKKMFIFTYYNDLYEFLPNSVYLYPNNKCDENNYLELINFFNLIDEQKYYYFNELILLLKNNGWHINNNDNFKISDIFINYKSDQIYINIITDDLDYLGYNPNSSGLILNNKEIALQNPFNYIWILNKKLNYYIITACETYVYNNNKYLDITNIENNSKISMQPIIDINKFFFIKENEIVYYNNENQYIVLHNNKIIHSNNNLNNKFKIKYINNNI